MVDQIIEDQDADLEILPYIKDENGELRPLEGVESIFLTNTTIEICKLNDLCNSSSKEGNKELIGNVLKEVILNDIQFRGAISDFHPIKNKIQNSNYDPLLIKYNLDDIYNDGNNFEIALKEAAAEIWKKAEERKNRLKLDSEVKIKEIIIPKSKRKRIIKPWMSLGSEIEIEEANVKNQREKIELILKRKKKYFNKKHELKDKNAQEFWNAAKMECRPFKDADYEKLIIEMDKGIQTSSQTKNIYIQTNEYKKYSSSTQYIERKLNENEIVNENDILVNFLNKIQKEYETCMHQNEMTDILKDEMTIITKEEDEYHQSEKENSLTEYQSFTDLTYSKSKVISKVQWLPHKKGVLAVSCSEPVSFEERVENLTKTFFDSFILIWNFNDPIHPECVLESPYELTTFEYNPINTNIIVAGSTNGQVLLWDDGIEKENETIQKIKYKVISLVEYSHSTPIMYLKWLPGIEISKTGEITQSSNGNEECNIFVTTATDGKILFWDIRLERQLKKNKKSDKNLGIQWKPIYSISLTGPNGGELPCSCLCYPKLDTFIKTKTFLASSVQGHIAYGKLLDKNDENEDDVTLNINECHCSAIVRLIRSPFFEDIILSVGDWRFQLWKEEYNDEALFTSPFSNNLYTSAVWSETRPCVLYLSNNCGVIEIWDLADKCHEASLRVTITSNSITDMKFNCANLNHHQIYLAVGDTDGILHILNIPRNLKRAIPNENNVFLNFLEKRLTSIRDKNSKIHLKYETKELKLNEAITFKDEEETYKKLEIKLKEKMNITFLH